MNTGDLKNGDRESWKAEVLADGHGADGRKDVERLRREPMERMLRIHGYLAERLYPNCGRLAREFEVSHKTVARDLEYMRDHFNLPIEYDSRRKGFFYSKRVESFPGTARASDTEIFALAVAHKAISQYQGLPLERPLEAGFKKLLRRVGGVGDADVERVLSAVSFRSMGAEEVDPRVMSEVTRAVMGECGLAFTYRRPGEERELARRVLPYHVVCIDGRFYMLGRDLDLNLVRKFVVSRMLGVRCTRLRFKRPTDFNPDEFLRKSFGAMTGTEDFEVIVVFDAWATDTMRGRHWHREQVVAELKDGRSVFCVRVSCLDEIERWVLSWGSHAKVIEPRELVDRVLRTMGEAAAGYRPNS